MITHLSDYDMSGMTTFHLPAFVKKFIEYDTPEELTRIIAEFKKEQLDFIHIGGGSNILFDGPYNGAVLHCRKAEIKIVAEDSDDVVIHASSGTVWDDFVKYAVDHELYGIENLSYIPGEVGGAAVQNLGAYGAEAKDAILSVEVYDVIAGAAVVFSVEDCHYGYRDSVFKHFPGRFIVTGVNFKLSRIPKYSLEYGPLKELQADPCLNISKVRAKVISVRQSKLPEPDEQGSAGSFFKNPVVSREKYEELWKTFPDMPYYDLPDGKIKIPAGWLIEHSGLKGYKIGGAQVYPKQCLVIVNTGNATAADVIELKNFIQNTVKIKFGIEISPEVNIVKS